MSAVRDIHAALKTEIAAVISSSFQELKFVYDVTQNDLRAIKDGWGVKILGASAVNSLTKAWEVDQGFEIILTTTAGRQTNDDDLVEAVLSLGDELETILTRIFLQKLGLPSIVAFVGNESFSEPDLLEEGSFVVMRLQIDVRYRKLII